MDDLCNPFTTTSPWSDVVPPTPQNNFLFKKIYQHSRVWHVTQSGQIYFPDSSDWLGNRHMMQIRLTKAKRFYSVIFTGTGEDGYPLYHKSWEEGPIWGCRTKRRKRNLVLVNVQSVFKSEPFPKAFALCKSNSHFFSNYFELGVLSFSP